ncbi:phospholipase A and acyltransferase 4 isoform X2 [Sapajus apella]|uniref:Phospholipase A and acyltransferase 4 isoform X2 n=1 Tax=Sapajus apella TaxID=9515 RepID=A0A6J3IAB9_SAPAP|nr:phospholipase A and acyltransferase 4 isoform X2 [Sapajus apella]
MASPHQELKPGDLIEIFRLGYQHWALYVGDGYVIHLAPPSEYPRAGPSSALSVLDRNAVVKQERLEDVVEGCNYRVNNSLDREYRPRPIQVIISSAKKKVGQKMEYNIVRRNCEHFVTELRYGKSRCKQVESTVDKGVVMIILGIVLGSSFAIGRYLNQ